jgi:hypothetical protein
MKKGKASKPIFAKNLFTKIPEFIFEKQQSYNDG